jgi:oligopeptide/dipeptide ABC transporter ATP-binding protein
MPASWRDIGLAEALLEVQGLKKHFPIRGGLLRRSVGKVLAVDGVDFSIRRGETLGLVGESGCGKTTVGRSILLLTKPSEGTVLFDLPDEVWVEVRRLEAQVAELLPRIFHDASQAKPANLSVGRLQILQRAAGMQQGVAKSDIEAFLDATSDLIRAKSLYDLTLKPASEIRQLRRRMQIVFQDPFSSMDPRMLVKNIVGEPLKVHGIGRWWCPACRTSPAMEEKAIRIPKVYTDPEASPGTCTICGGPLVWTVRPFTGREVRSRVMTLLERVGLNPEHLYRFPHEFSGGQRQRIGIARALALNPDFIVLDEPTSALDVSVQAQILNLLKELQRELGLTYLFISHHLAVINHICNRVNVMYLGEIVESTPTEELFRNPLHPYTKALMSAIPIPDPDTKMTRVVLPGDVPSPANPPAGCRFHPRCPVAFEICGWTAEEVLDILDVVFNERQQRGAKEPNFILQVELEGDGVRFQCAPGTAAEVHRFVEEIVAEKAETLRGLKAVASTQTEENAVKVSLHAGRVPLLKEVRRDHAVACHLY